MIIPRNWHGKLAGAYSMLPSIMKCEHICCLDITIQSMTILLPINGMSEIISLRVTLGYFSSFLKSTFNLLSVIFLSSKINPTSSPQNKCKIYLHINFSRGHLRGLTNKLTHSFHHHYRHFPSR